MTLCYLKGRYVGVLMFVIEVGKFLMNTKFAKKFLETKIM